jgi:threonine dehydratase
MHNDIPTISDVRAAHTRISPWIHRTPVLTCETFDKMTGAALFFKCENFQKTGAFKARGAHNAVFSLSDKDAAAGVATHSSGNHGAALCFAAANRGIPATVVMPENSTQVKIDAVRNYGGHVVTCPPSNAARETTLNAIIDKNGAHFVHPYNDFDVIAGQGTCALELLEEVAELDAVIAPVGGGGLIGGSAICVAEISKHTAIFAAEPKNADDAFRSVKAGHIIEEDAPNTIADGLRTSLGSMTFPIINRYVTEIILISESQIVDAMRLIWQRMKIVVEPSSAVALAAIFAQPEIFRGKRVGVIFTGGNVDLNELPWMV